MYNNDSSHGIFGMLMMYFIDSIMCVKLFVSYYGSVVSL